MLFAGTCFYPFSLWHTVDTRHRFSSNRMNVRGYDFAVRRRVLGRSEVPPKGLHVCCLL